MELKDVIPFLLKTFYNIVNPLHGVESYVDYDVGIWYGIEGIHYMELKG